MKSLKASLPLLFVMSLLPPAAAQTYPSRSVTVVVPYAPGGLTDIVARITAQALSEEFGQSFVVENRDGGGGMNGVTAVAQAAPDGHTLLAASTGPATISPLLQASKKFDPLVRLEPIIQVASSPAILLVRKGLAANTLAELIALSKASPGTLNFASAGRGSFQHLVGEYFQSDTGTKWTHIPFRGSAPALTELVAERVDVLVDVVPTAAPFVRDGRMRAIAVMAPKRTSQLPDVPTFQELGFKGYDFSGWHGLFAPKGTPADAIAKLNAAANKFLQKPDIQAKLAAMGAGTDGGTSAQLRERMQQELRDWAAVIRSAGVPVD